MKNIKFVISLLLILGAVTVKPVKAAGSSMTVNVGSDVISINVNHVGKRGTAQLYAYNANQYASDDELSGKSNEITDEGTLVGDYTCGSDITFSRDRYVNGVDGLYQKYYVIQDGHVLKGPIYATKIKPINKTKVTLKQKSIKGLYNENYTTMKYAKDLKVNSITINLDLSNLFNFGSDHSGDEEFVSNGKTYYVKKSAISHYDTLIRNASKNNMNVIAIIAPWITDSYNNYPKALRYSDNVAVMYGTNTSNNTGRDDYIAMMEFLAGRYSRSKETGLISTYVVSNEVDFTPYFYDCYNFDKYMEEYTRSLRLTDLAIKKYASDANVAIPFTHYWKGDQRKMGKECKGASYTPYNILQWVVKHETARGNYDWGIAPHSYGWASGNARFANSDTKKRHAKFFTGSYKTTKTITFSNLEVFDQYLSKKAVKYNGRKRSVYLTESGVSSGKYKNKFWKYQAMSLYQAYYKAANLPFIKSFNYYRLRDDKTEYKSDLNVGLLKKDGKKKLAYSIYKDIDTKKGHKNSQKYLKLVSYRYNGKTRWSYKNGKIRSWKKAMQIYKTGYNWNKKYKLKNIYRK